jgi:hypothetical protein
MATENIGTKYNTQIPALTENADIQTALKIYHYGQANEPTNLIANSVAGHFKTLEDTKVDIFPTALNSGTNLNSQTTTGYYSSTNAVAASGSNYPVTIAGMLHVTNDNINGFVYQSYFAYATNKVYWRGFASSWSAWKEASDTTHSHPEFSTFQPNIIGAASTITSSNLTSSRALASDSSGKVAVSAVTATELGHLSGVTSGIQAQLNTKSPSASPTFSGVVTLPATTSIGTITSTEIGYVDGVTSSIQDQLNTKSPSESPTFTGTVVLPSTTSIGNVSSTEIGFVDGLTSSAQTQLNNKPTQLLGNKSAGTPVPAGTKRIVIARDNGSGAPDATITPAEGDLWFW